MSFFSRSNKHLIPGRICGNPLNELTHRACIEVNKVVDSCRIQQILRDVTMTLTNYNPSGPALPLTFLDGRQLQSEAVVTDVHIDRLIEKPNFAEVRCNVTIPLKFIYLDANNIRGTAESQITVPVKTILYVPKDSMTPIQISADASCHCSDGIFVSPSSFTCTDCINIILKEIATVELLIPTYGYCHIPCCTPGENTCDQFFELPLFPHEN